MLGTFSRKGLISYTEMRLWLCFCLVLIARAAPGFCQAATTGTLSGTVTDSSESRVPKAAVIATNSLTNATFQGITSDIGEYRLVLLPPGLYDIKVEHPGFRAQDVKSVWLTVGEEIVMNFRVAVRSGEQTLAVTAAVPPLESQRTQISGTIDASVLMNLPVDRRNLLAFVYLLPGVSDTRTTADFNSFRLPQTRDSGLAISGGDGRGNSFTLDGNEVNSASGGVRPMIGQEAVREFQVSRANYLAENGSARGAVVNIVTRSGTNRREGSLFGFARDQVLDAAPPFALVVDSGNRLERVKPPSDRQQFGATLGGPVARDRTFYFLNYEQLRRRESHIIPLLTDLSIFQPTPAQQAALATLPEATAALLSALLTASPTTQQMFRINSGASPFQTDQHQGLLRVDHRANDRNQLTFRYYAAAVYETDPNLSGLTARSRGDVRDDFASSLGAAWVHILRSQVINELRVQFNYADSGTASTDRYGPALEIAGYGSFNRDGFLPAESLGRREEIIDNLHVTRGRHSVKAGPYILVRNTHSDSATLFGGRFTFGELPGSVLGPSFAAAPITALQAFNLGLAQSYQQGFGNPIVAATYPLYAAYIQDSWRASQRLTVNYGIRWEADVRRSPLPSNKLNLSPRVGFAWSPTDKFVIRGGYGIFYSPVEYQIDYAVTALNEIGGVRRITQILTTLDPSNPFAVNGPINIFQTLRAQGVIGIPTPQRSISASDLLQFGIAISPTGPRPPFAVLVRNAPDFRNSYVQQAGMEVERQVVRDLFVTAGVVYLRGVHLTTSYDANLLSAPVDPALGIRNWGVTPENPTGTKYFVDPQVFQDNVYESGANSWYTGLTLEATRHFSNRFMVTANYTFSKAIDETADYEPDYQPDDQTCRRCERALSSFDQRHKVVFYGQLDTPGGFVLSPVFLYNSSRPFNLLSGTDLNNDRHETTDRPLFAGRNIGIGPAYWTLDVRLQRTIQVSERCRLQLMADGFNLFNHLNYASVNNIVGASIPTDVHGRNDRGASQPLGFTSAFAARGLQLGLRLVF